MVEEREAQDLVP